MISVIIPVYNVAKYIRECLDSIIKQTYHNWEALLIDDGSPDRSGEICDEYASIDSRFRVIHKENGGVSSARNIGLQKASGEYILFLDSDDMLHPSCLATCYELSSSHKLDLLQFGLTSTFTNETLIVSKSRDVQVERPTIFFQHKHNVCIAGSFIKRDIILRNLICFNERMKLAEDQIFILACIKNSSRVSIIPDDLYFYRMNIASATHNAKLSDIITSCEILVSEKKANPEYANQVDNTILSLVVNAIAIDYHSEQMQSLLNIYRRSDVKHCDQVQFAGKVFCYISKISLRLAAFLYYTYCRLCKIIKSTT